MLLGHAARIGTRVLGAQGVEGVHVPFLRFQQHLDLLDVLHLQLLREVLEEFRGAHLPGQRKAPARRVLWVPPQGAEIPAEARQTLEHGEAVRAGGPKHRERLRAAPIAVDGPALEVPVGGKGYPVGVQIQPWVVNGLHPHARRRLGGTRRARCPVASVRRERADGQYGHQHAGGQLGVEEHLPPPGASPVPRGDTAHHPTPPLRQR